jgi:uncharacterized protein YqgC (DUF456 family)
MLYPAFIGGLVVGVLSALPFISAGNVCCCLWVVSGGAVAAYVLQQKKTTPISAADGAVVGLLAGIIGAGVYLLVAMPVTLLMAPLQRELFEQLINSGRVPPQFEDYLNSRASGAIGLVIGFFAMLAAGIIFSTLGGLLGVAMFRKKPAPVVDTAV